jgi:phosphoribosylcarboxyaminoimidazole (NCAIR) mutase
MSIPSDLVVFKAIAGRARDLDDVEALLVLYPDIDVPRARARIAELAELAGVPELVAGFDSVVKRARTGVAKRSSPKKRTR